MKKDIILQTAAQLFSKYGYHRTSTAQLADVAGVAEGTIFRHFKNKEHIFIALLEQLRNKMYHDVYQYLEIQGDQPAIQRIESMIKACYIFVNKNNADFTLLLRDAPGHFGDPNSQAFGYARTIYSLLHEYFQKAIEQGQRENSIRSDLNPTDTACFLASSLMGIIRVVHLNFLETSENILDNFIFCTKSLLEKR